MVAMITASKRKLTEVSLYVALGGEVSRIQVHDPRLTLENEVRVTELQQKVITAIEDRLDIDILVTAEQKAESMTLAALPALLDIVEPESIEAETGMDVDDTVVMAKGEDTSSVQPAE